MLESMGPYAWVQVSAMEAELRRLAEMEGNAHVHVVEGTLGYNTKPDRPLHQLELMNSGGHWFLLLHSRQQEGPDQHFCLDPLGMDLRPSAAVKYPTKTHVWSATPLQELFNVKPAFKPLQNNTYDCGPGVLLLASAVIQQLGTGTSQHKDMTVYLHTPLSQVRMEAALHAFLRTTSERIITKPHPRDIISLEQD